VTVTHAVLGSAPGGGGALWTRSSERSVPDSLLLGWHGEVSRVSVSLVIAVLVIIITVLSSSISLVSLIFLTSI
jgi:hypothetical protein